MKKYADLIDQTFHFPTPEFKVSNNELLFNNVPVMDLVGKYGTPLKLSYLPKISEKIQEAKTLFGNAMKKAKYSGEYIYSYCTKSSHFSFVLEEVLKTGSHIETSSAFDIPILRHLQDKGKMSKETMIICNGYKRPAYTKNIVDMVNDGFNCIPVLDTMSEFNVYEQGIHDQFEIGVRVASDEEPNFEFYTSRLGIRYSEILDFYKERLAPSKAKVKMLHFFINTGVKDNAYYWSELSRFTYAYCALKKICPELDTIDIGGGFPIKKSLGFDFNYQELVDEIIENIRWICGKNNVPEPHIITEFGSYTVGESGAVIYSVLDQKQQNDKELWYMIDGSFITHLPDSWGTNQKFILLPINHWSNNYHKVNLGGLTCDHLDYYNSETHSSEVFLPKIKDGEQLYIGLFHTGAYQESLGGYGGIQHCLIPTPRHVLIDKDETGGIHTSVFAEHQESSDMMKVLGY